MAHIRDVRFTNKVEMYIWLPGTAEMYIRLTGTAEMYIWLTGTAEMYGSQQSYIAHSGVCLPYCVTTVVLTRDQIRIIVLH